MKFWQHRTPLSYLLLPFSMLFWLVSQGRKWLFTKKILKSYRSPVPILVVGNISVGGNGKTPVVIWLVEQLQQRGLKVGVISRGYGGKNRLFPQYVTAESDPALMGDEPVLIASRTGSPVAISPNRQQSIELLLKHSALDLIVADDGLQHYALARDMEWVVIDGDRRFGNGWLLPAGSLRELPSRLKNVDAIICNGGQAEQHEHQMTLQSNVAINLKTGEKLALSAFDMPCVAIAGIGYPPRFFTMLATLGIHLSHTKGFADHQHFSIEQIAPLAAENTPLLMTEKDAVKCRAFAQANWWYVPVVAHFNEKSTAYLLDPVMEVVRKNHEKSIS